MKCAGGAGRQDGVHMVHTFEEMRTRNPADTNKAAPEAIMPQAALEALPPSILWGTKIPKPAKVRNTTFFVKLYHKEHIFRS